MDTTIFNTESVEAQKKDKLRKLANHFNAGNCDLMDRPLDNFDTFITKEGLIYQLETVIPNKSKKCPNKHNGDTAIYKIFKGAIGYDN